MTQAVVRTRPPLPARNGRLPDGAPFARAAGRRLYTAADVADDDWRSKSPGFQGDLFTHHLALEEANAASVPLPTAAAQQFYTAAIANGLEDDFSITIRFMEEWAGVSAVAETPGAP